MRQPRRTYRSDEEYARAGFQLFVFREKATGIECRVFAKSLWRARQRYKEIVANRDKWQAYYRAQNEKAMKPFLEQRRKRMEELNRVGERELFDASEVETITPAKKEKRRYEKKKPSTDVQLELF